MSGARSRDKGHRWEVKCANELSERTGLQIVTTRSLGATYGADLCTVTSHDARGRPVTHVPSVLGWSVECKAWSVRIPRAWLRQAEEQKAPGLHSVVLWLKPHHEWESGSAFVLDEEAPRGWREMSIGEWCEILAEQALDIFRPPSVA